MYNPLADEIRPANLDEVVGQGHILGEDGMLRHKLGAKSLQRTTW